MSIGHKKAEKDRARKRFQRRRRNPFAIQSFSWLSEWNSLTMISLSGEHLSPKAQQRLMRLFALLLDRPEITVRIPVLRGCTRLAAADEEQALLLRLLEAMDSDNEDICTAAARAIFGTCTASDAPLIGQAIGRLLPNRYALQTILQVLREAVFVNKRQFLPIVRAVLEALAADPITIELRVELAIAFLPWDEVVTLLEMAITRGELHARALNRAYTMLYETMGRYMIAGRSDIKDIVLLEETLATSHDERLRMIALAALVAQSELPQGWNEERRARLQSYRADPSVLVAAAAQFTFLPNKEE